VEVYLNIVFDFVFSNRRSPPFISFRIFLSAFCPVCIEFALRENLQKRIGHIF
jgi:hypothetical protein